MTTTHLRCTLLDQSTRMFTTGKAYAVRPGAGITREITDDLGHTRVLSSSNAPRFIVGYTPIRQGGYCDKAQFAYFQPIDMDWRLSDERRADKEDGRE